MMIHLHNVYIKHMCVCEYSTDKSKQEADFY